MFERFTDQARDVMVKANQHAQTLGYEYIGSAHILLSLMKLPTGVAVNLLAEMNVDILKLRNQLDQLLLKGLDVHTAESERSSSTSNVGRIIEHAIDEMSDLRHNYVGTEHLLLGIVRDEESTAAKTLKRFGADYTVIRARVVNLPGKSE